MKKFLSMLLTALLIPLQAQAQQITAHGPRGSYADATTRGVYEVSITSGTFAVVDSLINLEAGPGHGFRITKMCVQPGSATTATYTLWQLIRTTTASSGGTLIANEATSGSNTVSKYYLSDPNWEGVARTGGTEGTSGAIIDQGMLYVGTATTLNSDPYCVEYCNNLTMCPTVEPGILNGVKLMFTGTTGAASQSARIYFVSE